MDMDDALTWAVAEFQRKPNTAYHKYEQYLRGDQPLTFATEKYDEAFGGVFREFAYNLCETVVDAHTDRMQVTGFGSDDDDKLREVRRKAIEAGQDLQDAAATSLAQQAQDIWDANNMDERAGQVHADMFGFGDAYVIVDMLDNEPVIWPARPSEMRVRYSEDRPGKIVAAARLWGEPKRWRLNVWTETELGKYQARRDANSNDAPKKPDQFTPLEGEADTIPNPVPGEVPVFHFANAGRLNDYGVSELRSVLPLQDGLNKTVTDMMVAMEFYAFRQRVILGVAVDPNDTKSKEMLETFQTGLLRTLTIEGQDGQNPSIAEFGEVNIKQYIDVIDRYEKKVAIISKVPRNYFGQRGADAISGESKKMDDTPFVKKIEKRETAAGSVWSNVQTYALKAKRVTVEPGDIRVNWSPADPVSEDQQVDIMLKKKAADYPFIQRFKEAGYEPEQIASIERQKAAEDAAAVDRQRSMFDAGFVPSGAD